MIRPVLLHRCTAVLSLWLPSHHRALRNRSAKSQQRTQRQKLDPLASPWQNHPLQPQCHAAYSLFYTNLPRSLSPSIAFSGFAALLHCVIAQQAAQQSTCWLRPLLCTGTSRRTQGAYGQYLLNRMPITKCISTDPRTVRCRFVATPDTGRRARDQVYPLGKRRATL